MNGIAFSSRLATLICVAGTGCVNLAILKRFHRPRDDAELAPEDGGSRKNGPDLIRISNPFMQKI